MTEHDIAHLYDEAQLRFMIECLVDERDFWFGLIEGQSESESLPYYKAQYIRYNTRLRDLRNLLKDMVYDG